MKISVQTNFPEIAKQLTSLREDIASKAMASALNKTTAQAKTSMSREIRAEFNIDAATVARALRVGRASASKGKFQLTADLTSISKPHQRSLNLAHFAARQTRKGVTFKVKKGGPRKLIKGAFLINGGATVMIREGKTRLPIHALQTINVSQMFNTKRINARVVHMIETKFPAIFANEVRFFTQRFNAAK